MRTLLLSLGSFINKAGLKMFHIFNKSFPKAHDGLGGDVSNNERFECEEIMTSGHINNLRQRCLTVRVIVQLLLHAAERDSV